MNETASTSDVVPALRSAWPVAVLMLAIVTGGALEFSVGDRDFGINTIQFAVAVIAVGAALVVWRAGRVRVDLIGLPYAVLVLVPILQGLRDGISPVAAGGIGRFVTVGVLLAAMPQFGLRGDRLRGWHVPVTLMGAAVGVFVLWRVVPAMGDPTLGFYDLKDVVRLPFGNHNYVAAMLAFALITTLAVGIGAWWRGVAAGLMAVGLVLTFSRGGWLAFAVAAAVLVLSRRDRGTLRTVAALAAAAVALLAVVVLAGGLGTDRVRGLLSPAVGPRLDLWEASWNAFGAHPVLGVGISRFPEWMTGVRQPYLHAHNLVLESLAATGVVGAVAYLTYWVGGALRVARLRTAERWWLGLPLIALFVHAQIDSLNFLLVYELVVAALFGIAAVSRDDPAWVREVGWRRGA